MREKGSREEFWLKSAVVSGQIESRQANAMVGVEIQGCSERRLRPHALTVMVRVNTHY